MSIVVPELRELTMRGTGLGNQVGRMFGWLVGLGISALFLFVVSSTRSVQINHPGLIALDVGIACCLCFVALWRLRDVLFDALGRYRIGASGIDGRFLIWHRRFEWTEVAAVDWRDHPVLSVGGRQLVFRGDMESDAIRLIRRYWHAGRRGTGRRPVPLFLQSLFKPGTWVAFAYPLVISGASCLTSGLRSPMSVSHVLVGSVLTILGLGCIGKAILMDTEKVTVTCTGLIRTTWVSRQEIAWERVEVLTLGLETEIRPLHGTARVRSGDGIVVFSTRDKHFAPLGRYLRWVCQNSFVVDDSTGEVNAPGVDDIVIRHRMRSLCGQVARRYWIRGVIQLVCLPVLLLAWVTAAFGGVLYFGCMPFTFASVRASFRKSRQAIASLQRYISLR